MKRRIRQSPPRPTRINAPIPNVAPNDNGKATAVEVLARKRYVELLMAKGYGSEAAAQSLAEEVNISIDAARHYCRSILTEWADLEKASRPTRLAQCVRVLESVIQNHMEDDPKVVVSAVKEIGVLTGLNVKGLIVTGNDGMAELQAKIQAQLASQTPAASSGDDEDDDD